MNGKNNEVINDLINNYSEYCITTPQFNYCFIFDVKTTYWKKYNIQDSISILKYIFGEYIMINYPYVYNNNKKFNVVIQTYIFNCAKYDINKYYEEY